MRKSPLTLPEDINLVSVGIYETDGTRRLDAKMDPKDCDPISHDAIAA